MADEESKELWENKNRGDVWPRTHDLSGNFIPTRVRPGQQIHLTTKERKMNQERAYGPEGDLFKNGALSAVAVDTAEDYEEIQANSNTTSEAEMQQMVSQHANKLKKDLENITSPYVLERLKEMTEDPQSDLSMAKVTAIKERYSEVVQSSTGKKFDAWEDEGSKKTTRL